MDMWLFFDQNCGHVRYVWKPEVAIGNWGGHTTVQGGICVSGEAVARKARSEEWLARHSIPINAGLPVIEVADEIVLRDGEAVMRRSMCLFAVSKAALDGNTVGGTALIENWQLEDALSPIEQSFLRSSLLSDRQKVQFSWRCEALVPLMWATGLFDELPPPDMPFDFSYLTEFWEAVPCGYWKGVGTRSAGEILDEADLIYRLHWAVRDADLNGKPAPGQLDASVVMERHHALNWLIGYAGDEWDDVCTDT